jgi:calcineurin-like phosphoesterase family protein
MTTWFSSDWHIGHKNILAYCNRPFRDVEHMNNAIIGKINEMVAVDDTMYVLGDVALGNLEDSLSWIKKIKCQNMILVPGNHDRVWNHWPHKTPEKRARFVEMYGEVFQSVSSTDVMVVSINNQDVMLSHLPYDGDSHEDERYKDFRPVSDLPLIHGHIHTNDTIRNNRQYHVGADAHGYKPVHEDVIKEWLDGLE